MTKNMSLPTGKALVELDANGSVQLERFQQRRQRFTASWSSGDVRISDNAPQSAAMLKQ